MAGECRKVFVPCCWETCPGLEQYRGVGVYETDFEAEGDIRIEWKGVSHFAKVFIDGEMAGEHYGSYTAFETCKSGLQKGVHHLRVEVDNSLDERFALDIPNDYMSYGGISRGVMLEQIPGVFIQWVHMTPLAEEDGVWTVGAEVSCKNTSAKEQRADIRITAAGQEITINDCCVPNGESAVFRAEMRCTDVTAWSMETPALYEVTVVLLQEGAETDDLIDRFGFRLIRVEGKRVLLNGRPVRIKGFCRHEDHPEYGCALPMAAMAHDLQLFLDMGANSVRTSHYPNDELFLDLCDEMGILVWEENHARGLSEENMKHPHFEEQCEQVIEEMITQHYNHPSIYIWGILNECASETEYGRTCYAAQYKKIESLDVSRPYSSASCKFNEDICQDLEKVCSWNIYPYWYDEDTAAERLTNLRNWLDTEGNGAGKPILVTEVGAGAVYGFRTPRRDVWSEELQSDILGKQLREIAAFEDCMGMYIWQFCDVKVSKEWAMRRPKSQNNKGIVDEYRRPKLAYETVKEIFSGLPDYWE